MDLGKPQAASAVIWDETLPRPHSSRLALGGDAVPYLSLSGAHLTGCFQRRADRLAAILQQPPQFAPGAEDAAFHRAHRAADDRAVSS